MFDPIFETPFSRNCFPFPQIKFDTEKIKSLDVDAVFISHYHDDHCSFESLNLLSRETPIYLFCVHEEMFELLKRLGFKNVCPLKIDTPVWVKDIEIITKKALDEDVDSIFHVRCGAINVLNVVDSWIGYDTLEGLCKIKWDLILWPFQVMREIEVLCPSRAKAPEGLPHEWIEQLQRLNPRAIVPSSCQFIFESWSWYNEMFFSTSYRSFETKINSILPQTEVIKMNPGKGIALDSSGLSRATAFLDFVIPIGNQNVDYIYDPDVKPPHTSEIAKKFAALTPEQTDRVMQYCKTELLDKYEGIEKSSNFFNRERLWRLSLYDHNGEATHFLYRLSHNFIQPAQECDLQLAWLTEVPISRLYSALEEGESLTSMYIRINDMTFSPEVENELVGVDLMEDPLLLCLYSGAFGSYQKAQLKRLGID